MKKVFIISGLFLNTLLANSVTYYVATTGNDDAAGTKAAPWGTWQKAFETAFAGDTVYFRGGTWYPTKYAVGNSITIIAAKKIQGIYTGNIYGHDGTKQHPICFFNYPGEKPVLDCSKIDTAGHEYNTGLDIFVTDYIHFKGLTICNVFQTKPVPPAKVACGIGPYVCSNLTFENMTVHDIGGRGFSASFTSGYYGITTDTTRFINCDVYNCADMLSTVPGNAADGFKMDAEAGGYYEFKGCRIWNCTDDGIDMSGSSLTVYNNCWSFKHGFKGSMDGNGFKYGGNRGKDAYINNGVLVLGTLIPGPTRIVKNCISAFNVGSGFYDLQYSPYYRNDSRVYNNTSYHDNIGFSGSTNADFPKNLSQYKNNIAYASTGVGPTGKPSNVAIYEVYTESHNTWDALDPRPGSWPWFLDTDTVKVTDADFILNDSATAIVQLTAPRKADGSLPEINFLKLAENSDLIDAGIDVGLPFSGKAPDIGAFEYVSASTGIYAAEKASNGIQLFQNSPNPFNQITVIKYSIPNSLENAQANKSVALQVYNLSGQVVTTLVNRQQQAGDYEVKFDATALQSGVYFYRLQTDNHSLVKKLILMK